MKKIITLIALVSALALSVTACGGKKSSAPETQATTAEPTLENGLPASKQPDPNAPKLAIVSLYVPDSKGNLEMVMDSLSDDTITEQALLDKLVEHKVLQEGVKAESFETAEVAGETEAAGPGAKQDGAVTVKNGTLTISGFAAADGVSEDTAKTAIENTFVDNYDLGKLALTVK